MVSMALGMAVWVGKDDIYLRRRDMGLQLFSVFDRADRKRSKCQVRWIIPDEEKYHIRLTFVCHIDSQILPSGSSSNSLPPIVTESIFDSQRDELEVLVFFNNSANFLRPVSGLLKRFSKRSIRFKNGHTPGKAAQVST